MCGKYYGVYDLRKNEAEACVGVFESTAEICAFFGGIKRNRVSSGIMRHNVLTLGKERYFIKVFREPTISEVRKLLRQRFGDKRYKITDDGIFTRQSGQSWQFYANDLEEAVMLMK